MRFAPSVRSASRLAALRSQAERPRRVREPREESLLLELLGVTLVMAVFLSTALLL